MTDDKIVYSQMTWFIDDMIVYVQNSMESIKKS